MLYFIAWWFLFKDLVSEIKTIGVEGLRLGGFVDLADWFGHVVM